MNIKVSLHVNEDIITKQKEGSVVASGWVELEEAIKFPIRVLKYMDTKENKEKMFVGYPSEKSGDEYKNILYPVDKNVRAEIQDAVLTEMSKQIRKGVANPNISEVKVSLLKEERLTGSVHLKAVASIQICGVVINGILIKEGSRGPFVQMPQRRAENGTYKDIVYGTNELMQTQIKNAVLAEYDTQRSWAEEKKELQELRNEINDIPEPKSHADSMEIDSSYQNETQQVDEDSETPENLEQPIVVGDAKYENGYILFNVRTDGCNLSSVFRIYDPENGPDMTLVSIEDADAHPLVMQAWDGIEAGLIEKCKQRYDSLIAKANETTPQIADTKVMVNKGPRL